MNGAQCRSLEKAALLKCLKDRNDIYEWVLGSHIGSLIDLEQEMGQWSLMLRSGTLRQRERERGGGGGVGSGGNGEREQKKRTRRHFQRSSSTEARIQTASLLSVDWQKWKRRSKSNLQVGLGYANTHWWAMAYVILHAPEMCLGTKCCFAKDSHLDSL